MSILITKAKPVLADGTVVESFEGSTDMIDVTSMLAPRLSWVWLCPKGHEVRWERDEGKSGTSAYHLFNVIEKQRKVSEWDEWTPTTYYVCAACPRGRKNVDFTYAYRSNTEREYVAGLTTYRLNGDVITKERAEEVIAAFMKRDHPEAVLA